MPGDIGLLGNHRPDGRNSVGMYVLAFKSFTLLVMYYEVSDTAVVAL